MGVFFDIAFSDNSTFTLNTPDVQVAADSRLYDGNGTRTETNLNGEYGWLADINAYNGGLGYYGISGSSFDAEEGAPAGWEDNGQFSTPIDPYASFPRGESPPAPNGADFGLLGSGGSGLPNGDEFYVTTSILISWDLGEWNSSPSMEIGQINFLYGTEYASTPVPEPATMFLLGTGLIGLAGVGRRFRKKG
ncbi:MAG: PEP-CTERM sorting domain-containing protein [Deltaproteobacteria bacterium]|nr:PEP-CTERM sorting domain-containing protein [Deltaproteobacteria bacterium]